MNAVMMHDMQDAGKCNFLCVFSFFIEGLIKGTFVNIIAA